MTSPAWRHLPIYNPVAQLFNKYTLNNSCTILTLSTSISILTLSISILRVRSVVGAVCMRPRSVPMSSSPPDVSTSCCTSVSACCRHSGYGTMLWAQRAPPHSRNTSEKSNKTSPYSHNTSVESNKTSLLYRNTSVESNKTSPYSHNTSVESNKTSLLYLNTSVDSNKTSPHCKK